MFYEQELGSYAQGQGSLVVFKVTARDQGHYKGPSGAFVTYCNISCYFMIRRLKPPNQKIKKGFLTSEKARISSHVNKFY